MNAPEKGRRRLMRAGDTAVFRTGSRTEFERLAARPLANPPKPVKGASVLRELEKSRR